MENPFIGPWNVVTENRPDQKMWITRHNLGFATWEFTPLERIEGPEGTVYEGILLEWRGKEAGNMTEYTYYPTENVLVIDRSDVAEDGFMRVCYEDRYRVERVDDDNLTLDALQKE